LSSKAIGCFYCTLGPRGSTSSFVTVCDVISDPCNEVECSGRGEHCVGGRCVCRHRVCPTNYDPVCGTDSVTYPNECTLNMIACTERRDIDMTHRGVCVDEFVGSGFEGALYTLQQSLLQYLWSPSRPTRRHVLRPKCVCYM